MFSTATGKRTHLLASHAMQAAFRPDGKVMATADYFDRPPCRLRLWDINTGKDRLLAKLPGYVNALAFSPDGKRLFAAVDGHSLRCWDTESHKELWQNDHAASSLVVAPDGRSLCSNSVQKSGLHRWDAATGRHLGRSAIGFLEPALLAFTPDGRGVFLTDFEMDVRLWNLDRGVVRCRFAGSRRCVALAPDGKTLAGVRGSLLRLWDVQTGRPLYPDTTTDGHTSAVRALVFTPDGRGLVSAAADGPLLAWSLATERPRAIGTDTSDHRDFLILAGLAPPRLSPPVLVVTSDGGVVCEAEGGQLHLLDISTGNEVRRFDLRERDKEVQVGTACLSEDGKTLWALTHHLGISLNSEVISERDETVFGWDVASGRCRLTRAVKCGVQEENRVAADGRSLAVAGGRVLDVASGKSLLRRGNGCTGYPCVFSADSHLLAGAHPEEENTLVIHELLTGLPLRRLPMPLHWSSRLAFSPDGRLLVAAGTDALHVWEVSTGRRLLHLPAEGRLPAWSLGYFATALAVSPDGRTAATGHEDGTILLWDLRPAYRQLAQAPAPALTAEQAESCWADLLAEDPGKAHAALDRLAAAPAQALPLLRKHLWPAILTERWLADRLAALDSDDLAVREKARRDLEAILDTLRPRLQREMEHPASLEVRLRLRRLLAPQSPFPSPERRRQLRAVMALERIASSEARDLLKELAGGDPGDSLTRAARGALVRLAAGRPQKP